MRKNDKAEVHESIKAKYLPEQGYRRVAAVALYAVLGVICLAVFARCLFDIFLPFVLAWLASMVVRPVILRIEKRFRISKKILSISVITAFYILVFGILFWICHRLLYEIGNAVGSLTQNYDVLAERVTAVAGWISSKLPSRLGDSVIDVDVIISTGLDMAKSTLSAISAKLPGIAASFVGALPGVVFFTVILIVSSYYVCIDVDGINEKLLARLPRAVQKTVREAGRCIKSAGFSYLRAYAFIMVVTFAELLTGFLILRIRYAVIAAIIIAIADMLPVIGVGAILTPWAIVLLIQGDTYRGIGLLIILTVIQLVRQVIEPKIVGNSIGLSPLGTLVSMYAGFRVAGIAGMLIAPVILLIAKSFLESSEKEAQGAAALGASVKTTLEK